MDVHSVDLERDREHTVLGLAARPRARLAVPADRLDLGVLEDRGVKDRGLFSLAVETTEFTLIRFMMKPLLKDV